ncbi:MAG: hypothetical protein MJ068_02740 [Clostridia bacterium]|nr:hypothetical protein [Clostridia bacterium]
MKKKVILTIVMVLVLLLALFAFTACDNGVTSVGDELITNGSFNTFAESKFSGWSTSSSSVSFSRHTAPTGDGGENYYLGLSNSTAGYSYLKQTVAVDTGVVYKVSLDVKSSGVTVTNGVHVSFIENEGYTFAGCTNTDGEWKTFTFYVSPRNTDYMTIALCLGSKEEGSAGTAFFDNISMQRVDEVPAGAEVVKFKKAKTVNTNSNAAGIAFVCCLSIGTALLCAGAYIAIRRLYSKQNAFVDFDNAKSVGIVKAVKNPVAIGVGLALVAGLVRLILLLTLNGSGANTASLVSIAKVIGLKDGVKLFMNSYSSAYILAPGAIYIYAIIGAMGANLDVAACSILIRFINVLADMAAVLLIYFYGKKYVGNKLSTIYAGLYAFLPIAFVTSGLNTTFEPVLVALMIGALYFLLDKKYLPSYLMITLAIVLDVRAFALAPIMLAYLGYSYYRDDKSLKKFTANRAMIVFGLVGCFVLAYLLTLPVAIDKIAAGDAFFGYKYMAMQVTGTDYFVYNALNLYGMATMNGKTMTKAVSILNLLFILVLEIYVVSLYFKNRNKHEIILLASFLLIMISVFTLKVSITFLFLGIAMAFIYAMVSGDKRMYFIASGYSFLGVTAIAELYNESGLVVPDATASMISFETKGAFYITFCVFAVLLSIYYVYVSYSITNNSKIVDIKPMNETFVKTVKNRSINFISRFKKSK